MMFIMQSGRLPKTIMNNRRSMRGMDTDFAKNYNGLKVSSILVFYGP